jgi:hypothetical protein
MVEGPGRVRAAIPWKTWATAATVAVLDKALRRWAELMPDGQPILVGNLSAPSGGKLRPHGSHQSGRDVDLGYPQKLGPGDELAWREMDASNLDAGATWTLLRVLAETGALEVVYIDRELQKLLHDHALEHEMATRRELAHWLEHPRAPGEGDALVVHVAGHSDHIHVRFSCPAEQTLCKTRGVRGRG